MLSWRIVSEALERIEFRSKLEGFILTEVIDDHGFTPLGPMRPRLIRVLPQRSIQQQVVNLLLAELLERLLREALHILQVGQLEREDVDLVSLLVVLDLLVGFPGGLDAARAEDDAVGLGLLEELLDGLETLVDDGMSDAGRAAKQLIHIAWRSFGDDVPGRMRHRSRQLS